MEPYVFDDVLTGSTVTCAYPGLDASAAKGASAPAACPSLFFPGCSFVNYGLPCLLYTSTFAECENIAHRASTTEERHHENGTVGREKKRGR